jgi:hypothetical protein
MARWARSTPDRGVGPCGAADSWNSSRAFAAHRGPSQDYGTSGADSNHRLSLRAPRIWSSARRSPAESGNTLRNGRHGGSFCRLAQPQVVRASDTCA